MQCAELHKRPQLHNQRVRNLRPMSTIKLIVGLGNPGPRYLYNRHNIGFQCVDLYAQRHNIEMSRMQNNARIGDGWVQKRTSVLDALSGGLPQVQRQKVLLVKPLTYMNLSGEAVGALVRYYDVPLTEVMVIHDDLDLAPGTLRLRPGGGSGGQNGIKSLIQHLGAQEFARLGVGIGRPPGRMAPADYVLQNFSKDEEENLFGPLRHEVLDALDCWIFQGMDAAMNQFNR